MARDRHSRVDVAVSRRGGDDLIGGTRGATGIQARGAPVGEGIAGLGGTGIPRADDRRFVLRVLDTILGGSSSSRLFQEVREKRGLAYSVYSYASHYADTGQVALYVGTRPDNVGEAMDVIGTELRRLQEDGVSSEELERARDNAKGRKEYPTHNSNQDKGGRSFPDVLPETGHVSYFEE